MRRALGLENEFDATLDKGRDSGEVTSRSTIPRINVDCEIDIARHQIDGRIHSLRTRQFAPPLGKDLPGARREPQIEAVPVRQYLLRAPLFHDGAGAELVQQTGELADAHMPSARARAARPVDDARARCTWRGGVG